MNRTDIEWCDFTWNPIVGCSAVSTGCVNCYAATMAKRFHRHWGRPIFKPERLTEPGLVKQPSKIFICSVSDLFHPGNPFERIDLVLAQTEVYPQHTYIVLTKRPGMALEWTLTSELGWKSWPENVWLGVTAETQALADLRLKCLNAIHAPVKFVSVEPMLGPVSIRQAPMRPSWVICGPETGSKARPCQDEWITALASECSVFFDKRKTGWTRREFPKSHEHR